MSHGLRVPALFTVALALAAACGSSKQAAPAEPGGSGGGSGDCEPGRCMEDISGVIEDHRPAARACYEAGWERDPSIQGRLIINFEIDPDGKVVDASQSAQDEQITDPGVVGCVEAVIRALTFKPSARGKLSRAFHRFEFNPPAR